MICQKVKDFVKTSAEFCEIVGLKISNPSEQKSCYNGLPSLNSDQTKLEPKVKAATKKVTKQRNSSDDEEEARVAMNRQKRNRMTD